MKKPDANRSVTVQAELIAKYDEYIAHQESRILDYQKAIALQEQLIEAYKKQVKSSSPFLEKQLADQQLVLQQAVTIAIHQTAKREKAEQQNSQRATALENLQNKFQAVKDAERQAKFAAKKK